MLKFLNRLKKNFPDFESKIPDIKPQIIINNSIDFKVLINVLLKSKSIIIFMTFLFGILGAGSSFLFNKYYKAEISLYPAKKDFNQGLGQFQSLAANLGTNNSNNDQNFNITDVVKSRLISNKVVNQKWKVNESQSIDLKKTMEFEFKLMVFPLMESILTQV